MALGLVELEFAAAEQHAEIRRKVRAVGELKFERLEAPPQHLAAMLQQVEIRAIGRFELVPLRLGQPAAREGTGLVRRRQEWRHAGVDHRWRARDAAVQQMLCILLLSPTHRHDQAAASLASSMSA